MAYDKNNIDKEAEAEAKALNRQGKNGKPKRLRFETGSYSKTEFDKLFSVDDLHENIFEI